MLYLSRVRARADALNERFPAGRRERGFSGGRTSILRKPAGAPPRAFRLPYQLGGEGSRGPAGCARGVSGLELERCGLEGSEGCPAGRLSQRAVHGCAVVWSAGGVRPAVLGRCYRLCHSWRCSAGCESSGALWSARARLAALEYRLPAVRALERCYRSAGPLLGVRLCQVSSNGSGCARCGVSRCLARGLPMRDRSTGARRLPYSLGRGVRRVVG